MLYHDLRYLGVRPAVASKGPPALSKAKPTPARPTPTYPIAGWRPRLITQLIGYAATFPHAYRVEDGTMESIHRGAFAEVLQLDTVVALIDHDKGRELATTERSSLLLFQDDFGLLAVIDADYNTPAGKQAVDAVRAGKAHGMSFKAVHRGSRAGIEFFVRMTDVSVCLSPPANGHTAVIEAKRSPDARAIARAPWRQQETLQRLVKQVQDRHPRLMLW